MEMSTELVNETSDIYVELDVHRDVLGFLGPVETAKRVRNILSINLSRAARTSVLMHSVQRFDERDVVVTTVGTEIQSGITTHRARWYPQSREVRLTNGWAVGTVMERRGIADVIEVEHIIEPDVYVKTKYSDTRETLKLKPMQVTKSQYQIYGWDTDARQWLARLVK